MSKTNQNSDVHHSGCWGCVFEFFVTHGRHLIFGEAQVILSEDIPTRIVHAMRGTRSTRILASLREVVPSATRPHGYRC